MDIGAVGFTVYAILALAVLAWVRVRTWDDGKEPF